MNPLMARLKKASKIAETSSLAENEILGNVECAHIGIPALDIAFTGELDGGLMSGLTAVAGPSRVFKSVISLVCAKAYLDKYDDAVMLFYDSEMGASKEYFKSVGIDLDRVLYTPITDIEVLKFELMAQLEQIKRGDHVVIVVDSVGNLASKKEVEDALAEKSAADMTRAKQLKSLTRMITPHLNLKNIPMIVVAHVYKEMSLFPKDIVSGGCVERGTQIIMADGTLKNIEHVVVGDMVKTLNGDHAVTATWNPETLENGTPTCYRVSFEDGTSVVCSDIHRFSKNGEWEFVTSLNVGDCLDRDNGVLAITKIEKIGEQEVFDISVDKVEHYLLANGVASHNTGLIYSSNQIFIISRSQEKKGTDIIGYNFNINIEKSRLVREKSRIPLTVTFEGGINRWSGLLEMALASGHVVKPSNGWYQKVNVETGEIYEKKYRASETNTADFWKDIINDQTFKDWVKRTFRIANDKLIKDDLTTSETDSSIAQFTVNDEEE